MGERFTAPEGALRSNCGLLAGTVIRELRMHPCIDDELEGGCWNFSPEYAVALGYSNPRDALSKHVDDEDRGVSRIATPSGGQEMTIINESGVYSLIFSSKLPKRKCPNWTLLRMTNQPAQN